MADVSAALIPSVAPEPRAPDSFQRIHATPEAFGGAIARGTEKLGAGVEKTSGNLFDIKQFEGKVNVDYEGNNYIAEHNKVLYGDPSRVTIGPDGQQVRDTGYMGLQGRAAADQREETLRVLRERREQGRNNLGSPQEKLDYDNQTRRIYSIAEGSIGQHATSQWRSWAGEVNNDGAKLSEGSYVVAVNANDAEGMAHHASDFISFKVKAAQLKFGDDPTVLAQTIAQAKQDLLRAQVGAVEVRDPVAAQRILDKNRTIAGADYTPLAEKLRGRLDQQEGIADADRRVKLITAPYASLNHPSYAAAAAAAPGGMSPAGLARTVQIESSGNPDAGAGGAHVGLGAFSVDAAAEVGITNRNDPEQSIRGIAKYAAKNAPILQKNLGRVPDDAELYLAHQQGAGGAAKLLANPNARAGDLVGDIAIRQNRGDPDAPAAAFTALWRDRFDKAGNAAGTGGNGAQLAQREGALKLSILNDAEMTARPQMQAAALARVGQWFSAQRETIAQDDAAFKLRVKNTLAEALDTGSVKTPIPREDFIATYGLADGETHYADYQANVQLGADMRATAVLSPAEMSALREKYRPAPGDSYLAQRSRAEALDKVIAAHMKVRGEAFKPVVQSSTAEALDTGSVKKPLSAEEFTAALGPEEGDRAFRDYQKNLNLGADIHAAAHLAPAELAALRDQYAAKPGAEDYILQGKRYDALDKAIRQNEASKQKDPAAFLIARTDAGAQAFHQFQMSVADPKASPAARSIAASLYAEKMLAEQARLGVPPDARRVVPQAYTDALTAKLNAPPDAKGAMPPIADMLEGEQKLWGSHWPALTRQLGKDSAPVVRVLSSGIKQGAAQTLQQLNGLSLAQILKDQDTEKNAAIKKDVLDAFKVYASSLVGNVGSLALFNDWRGEGEKLAASYVVGGMTSKEAADKTFQEMLGFKYVFENGYRVPKDIGVAADDIARGTVMALRDLGKNAARVDLASVNTTVAAPVDYGEIASGTPTALNVRAAGDKAGGLSTDYLTAGKIASLQRSGKWATAPNEEGLMLHHDGQVVKRADGEAFILSWKQLGDLADQYKREVSAVTHAGAEGFSWAVQ